MTNIPTAARIRLFLENAIVDGKFHPGDRIDPDRIAADYNCSRTPVREALQALEASGLLTVQPKRGTFVNKLGLSDLMHRFEVMAQMEALCASLACRRASHEDHAAIKTSLIACEAAARADDSDGYYAQNTKFHQAIYRASHNPFLESETQRLQAMLQPYRRLQLKAVGRVQTSLAEHRAIATAIIQGDVRTATQAMTDHVLVQGERFQDLAALIDSLAADRGA